MKKVLMFAVSMFVVCSFLSSCSKEDRNKITNGGNQAQNVNTNTPNDTISAEEKNIIENSDNLNSADYEIFELRFGSNFISGGHQEFIIVNNANYSFVVGLKNKSTGNILYKVISVAEWTFSSDNAAITENGNTGFNASSSFYSDTNAKITVDISYKGLNKIFNFTLKSNISNNVETPQIFQGSWTFYDGKYGYVIMTFSGDEWELRNGDDYPNYPGQKEGKGKFIVDAAKKTITFYDIYRWDDVNGQWIAEEKYWISGVCGYVKLSETSFICDGYTYTKI
ncbi:MAG: hypothetical protein LBL00_03865 [Endomicrobium sp.]|jgi:hypothetical protein|nr:hypothetical protein [Endomicrobium sp.]